MTAWRGIGILAAVAVAWLGPVGPAAANFVDSSISIVFDDGDSVFNAAQDTASSITLAPGDSFQFYVVGDFPLDATGVSFRVDADTGILLGTHTHTGTLGFNNPPDFTLTRIPDINPWPANTTNLLVTYSASLDTNPGPGPLAIDLVARVTGNGQLEWVDNDVDTRAFGATNGGVVNVVPEPDSTALFAAGLLVVGYAVRRSYLAE